MHQGPGEHQRADGDPSRTLPAETAETVRDLVRDAAVPRARPAQGIPRALRAIAGMLGRVAGEVPSAEASIELMLDEIVKLERLAAVDLERADRVKAALEHGVEAMSAIAQRRAGWLTAWVDAARSAVAGIDPRIPLGLQRAPVQDALRALADAGILAAGRLGK